VTGAAARRTELPEFRLVGDHAGDQLLASALGLPRPAPGEFVSARLARCPEDGQLRDYARSVRIAGAHWVPASTDDPPEPAPLLPR